MQNCQNQNILTIDFEDWHQVLSRRISSGLVSSQHHISRQLDFLLNTLRAHKTKATFFILGMLAEKYPELVKRISAEGHEIASHGYCHLNLKQISQQQFEEDTIKSKIL